MYLKIKQFDDIQLYVRDEKDWGFWQNDTFEPEETELIKSIVKSNDVCLDIGANIGYFTILMAKRCKLVWSYEPETSNYQQLRKNILLNKTFNIYVNHVALTDKSGEGMLYLCPINNGMHRVYPSRFCDGTAIVKTQKFDDAWDNLNHFQIDFIKMDAEGSELGVLKGMKGMLQILKPTIVMEFHPPSIEESGANPKEIYDLLKSIGYSIYLIPNIKEEFSYEELYLQTDDPSGGQNILCQNQNKKMK